MPYSQPPGTLDGQAIELVLDDLARGWNPTASPRGMNPDGPEIFRDLVNFAPRDGHLARRAALKGYEANLAQTLARQEVVHRLLLYEGAIYRITLIVTNRAIYRLRQLGPPGSPSEMLYVGPVYTTGTVTVTNGSAAVTGAGTEWSTRSISGGQAFSADGGATWYEISNVSTNTALTLTTAYTGTSGGGKAYIIRRTFSAFTNALSGSHDVFMAVYNNKLYLAGSYLGRGDTTAEPAVIRVSDLDLSSVSATYITASKALIPGLDFIASLRNIKGLAVLQDSRVVLAASEGAVYYSSNLSDAVWTVSPAGSTVVTLRSGAFSAMGRVGNTLTLHYPEGIVLAHPTGQTDPPLSYQPTAATVGCAYSPRTLRTYDGGEMFIGPDRNLHRFDMSRTVPLGAPLQWKIKNLTPVEMRNLHSAFDLRRREFLVAYDSSAFLTTIYHLRLDDGTWFYTKFGAGIGALSDRQMDEAGQDSGHQLVGLNRNDSLGGVIFVNLGTFQEGSYEDTIGTGLAGILAETEDFDCDTPWHYKILDHVVVSWRGASAEAESLVVSASGNGGSTWVTASRTLTHVTSGEAYLRFAFRDSITAAVAYRFRIEVNDTNRVVGFPLRLRAQFEVVGVVDQVEL